MTCVRLNQQELNCLRQIAGEQDGSSLPPCPWYVLEHLMALGLIELYSRTMLPLPLLRRSFRLTPAGISQLQQERKQPGE